MRFWGWGPGGGGCGGGGGVVVGVGGLGDGGRDSPRRATSFSLLRQRKGSKRKATLLWASLRCATGNLRCSLFVGSAQTRCAQTRAALIHEKLCSSAPLEGSARAVASLGT